MAEDQTPEHRPTLYAVEQLQHAVGRVIGNLCEVIGHLDDSPGELKARHLRVIELELSSLRSLARELVVGPPTRRSWSLGQASVPILNSMVNAIRRAPVDVPEPLLERTAQSVTELAAALQQMAEGRD